MGTAIVSTALLQGVTARPVRVEAHVVDGLAGFNLVGAPNEVSRELRDRVRSAILAAGLGWPRRITINLSPPDLARRAATIDLAVALVVLAADRQVPSEALVELAALGRLMPDGGLDAVHGGLALIEGITEPEVLVPPAMVREIGLAESSRRTIRTADDLAEVVSALRGDTEVVRVDVRTASWFNDPYVVTACSDRALCGALEVAAAGGHNLLVVGPETGAINAIIAEHLLGLLPALSEAQALEVARIHSAARLGVPKEAVRRRPVVRRPRQDASMVSLVGGGGQAMRPGELSLAHNGVLFLDEILGFEPSLFRTIASVVERGHISVRRADAAVAMPARFQLIATTKPCPCGNLDRPDHECRCTGEAIWRHHQRLSPLRNVDVFELRARLHNPPSSQPGAVREISEARASIETARAHARCRGVDANSQLDPSVLDEVAPLTVPAADELEHARRAGRLTTRGTDAVRRVALTVADLTGDDPPLDMRHITAALVLHGS